MELFRRYPRILALTAGSAAMLAAFGNAALAHAADASPVDGGDDRAVVGIDVDTIPSTAAPADTLATPTPAATPSAPDTSSPAPAADGSGVPYDPTAPIADSSAVSFDPSTPPAGSIVPDVSDAGIDPSMGLVGP